MLIIPKMRVFLNKTKQNKTNTKSRKFLTINIKGLCSMKWELGGKMWECVEGGGGGWAIGVD